MRLFVLIIRLIINGTDSSKTNGYCSNGGIGNSDRCYASVRDSCVRYPVCNRGAHRGCLHDIRGAPFDNLRYLLCVCNPAARRARHLYIHVWLVGFCYDIARSPYLR